MRQLYDNQVTWPVFLGDSILTTGTYRIIGTEVRKKSKVSLQTLLGQMADAEGYARRGVVNTAVIPALCGCGGRQRQEDSQASSWIARTTQ